MKFWEGRLNEFIAKTADKGDKGPNLLIWVGSGVISKSGAGDLSGDYCTTYEEAEQLFEEWKEDTKGWTKHGTYTIEMWECWWNEDEETYQFSDDGPIDVFQKEI